MSLFLFQKSFFIIGFFPPFFPYLSSPNLMKKAFCAEDKLNGLITNNLTTHVVLLTQFNFHI